LTKFDTRFDVAIRFFHYQDDTSEWRLDFGDSDIVLDINRELPELVPVALESRKKTREQIILRRIALHPDERLHHKGLISDYYKESHFKEAREACLKCLERWPEIWWPNLMLSMIDLKLGESASGGDRLSIWAKKHNQCSHFCLLAYFYQQSGQKEKCFEAVRTATELPITDLAAEWEDAHEHFGAISGVRAIWYATELAYLEGRVDLCLLLCDRWQQYVDKYSGDYAFHLYRAACFLRQGKLTDASKEVRLALKSNYASCHGDEVQKLVNAIEVGDTSFRYSANAGKRATDSDYWELVINYK